MRREMKMRRRRRRDLTKKARVLCDFCGLSSSSRYEQRPHKQDDEALLIESELKRLRLLTRRMTGKDLDGLSFAELLLLESCLKQVLLTVKDQKKKTELEENRKQKKEAEDEGTRRGVLAPCKFPSSSSGDRQEKQDDEAPPAPPPLSQTQIEYEKRKAESIQSEFERLWLLKERMNGRELVGMTSSELRLLEGEINRGLLGLHEHRFGPRMEQIATQQKEKLISQLRDVEERLGTR